VFFQRKAAQDIPHLEIQRYFDSVEKYLSNPGSPMCIESESTRFFNHNTVQQAVSAPNNGIWKDLTSSMVSWYGPFDYPKKITIFCFFVLPCQYLLSMALHCFVVLAHLLRSRAAKFSLWHTTSRAPKTKQLTASQRNKIKTHTIAILCLTHMFFHQAPFLMPENICPAGSVR